LPENVGKPPDPAGVPVDLSFNQQFPDDLVVLDVDIKEIVNGCTIENVIVFFINSAEALILYRGVVVECIVEVKEDCFYTVKAVMGC